MSIYYEPWTSRFAADITVNKTDTNPCSQGAFKVRATNIKRTMTLRYVNLCDENTQKEGRKEFWRWEVVIRKDVYEKKTFERSPERVERARERVTQVSVQRAFQAEGTAGAKVLRWACVWNV